MTVGPVFQRVLALAILAAVLLAAWAWVVVPVADRFVRYEESADQSRLLIERYRRVLATEAALKSELEAIRSSRIMGKGFLVAPSAELGAAQLQERIKRTAESAAAELVSVQVLAPKEDEDFSRVAVRARLKADIAALWEVLYDLETAWPAMFIDNLSVRARSRRSRRASAEAAALTVEPVLNIRFDVYAYMAGKPGAPAPQRKAAGSR